MDFADFRAAADNVLKDVSDLLGAHVVLGTGAKLIAALLQQQQAQQQPVPWNKFEAGIWMCTRLSRAVTKDEAESLPGLFQALPQLPSHPVLSPLSMEVVRRYAFWVRAHQEQVRACRASPWRPAPPTPCLPPNTASRGLQVRVRRAGQARHSLGGGAGLQRVVLLLRGGPRDPGRLPARHGRVRLCAVDAAGGPGVADRGSVRRGGGAAL